MSDVASLQDALLAVVTELAAHPDLSDVLRLAVSLMEERFPVFRVSIVLVRPSEGLAFVVQQGQPLESLTIKIRDYPELEHVIGTHEPLIIADLFQDTLMRGVRQKLEDAAVEHRSAVLFPLLRKNVAVGALFLRSRQVSPTVAPELLTTGRLIASLTALVVGNALEQDSLKREKRALLRTKEQTDREMEGLKHFSEVFESSYDGIVITDRSGVIRYVNPAAARVMQRDRSFLPKTRFFELLSQRSVVLAERAFRGDQVGDAFGYVDLLVMRPHTTDAVVSAAVRPIAQPEGVLISFRDVTELREIENELRTTKDFLENLIQSSVDAIVSADIDGRIILFNRAAEQLLGFHARETVGRMNIRDLYPNDEASDVMRRLRSDGYGGRGRLELMRKELLAKSGELVPVNLTAAIIYEDDQEMATVGIFTDLRERVRMEEKLSQVQKRLQMTERQSVAIELAGAAAHELNQPLTSILGYAEMLKTRVQPTDKNRKAVEVICRETERMAGIVRKIGQITAYKTQAYIGGSQIMDFEQTGGRARRRDTIPVPPVKPDDE
ncbi:MAG: PAS domain S-box protein [Clostridia bacterium]|nr:PAS domain S-box protein [Deltaproteobacteria bacterium]